MNNKDNYWKIFWEQRPQNVSSDYELDRVSSCRNMEVDKLAEKKLIYFIDPKKNDIIFDAGCGTGINIGILHSNVLEIIGMDISADIIDRARERMKRENINNAKLMVGNIADTKLSSNRFSKIICLSVLQYLDDQECIAAIEEFIRISKNNALLILHVKNFASLNLLTLFIAKKMKNLFTGNVKMVHYRTHRWYEKKLKILGAEIVDYDSVNIMVVDFIPAFLLNKIRIKETKYKKDMFLKKFGSDYFIKAKIIKV